LGQEDPWQDALLRTVGDTDDTPGNASPVTVVDTGIHMNALSREMLVLLLLDFGGVAFG
jgi:hypothetical protein